MKHTKGEWEFVEDSFNNDSKNLGYGSIVSDEWFIAEILPNVSGPTKPSPQSIANAKLIAAAPELLHRLKLAVEFLGHMTPSDNLELLAMQAAIKKATN